MNDTMQSTSKELYVDIIQEMLSIADQWLGRPYGPDLTTDVRNDAGKYVHGMVERGMVEYDPDHQTIWLRADVPIEILWFLPCHWETMIEHTCMVRRMKGNINGLVTYRKYTGDEPCTELMFGYRFHYSEEDPDERMIGIEG
jgi:hypothetical protein